MEDVWEGPGNRFKAILVGNYGNPEYGPRAEPGQIEVSL